MILLERAKHLASWHRPSCWLNYTASWIQNANESIALCRRTKRQLMSGIKIDLIRQLFVNNYTELINLVTRLINELINTKLDYINPCVNI